MSGAQPIMSMVVTAAQRYVLTAADFSASAPYNAAIENLRFLCGVTVYYEHSAVATHYLSLLPDIAGGSPVDEPLDELDVSPSTTSAEPATKRREWMPPLAADRLDLVFADKFWGSAGKAFFKPSGNILVVVHAYPSRFTG